MQYCRNCCLNRECSKWETTVAHPCWDRMNKVFKTTSTNEKYTFRTWLLRLGMIGDEFKTARKFLLENLEGGIAWKDPEQAERQKERLRAKKEKEEANQTAEAENLQLEEGAEEESQGMHMTM